MIFHVFLLVALMPLLVRLGEESFIQKALEDNAERSSVAMGENTTGWVTVFLLILSRHVPIKHSFVFGIVVKTGGMMKSV